jgi:hypothetical protein
LEKQIVLYKQCLSDKVVAITIKASKSLQINYFLIAIFSSHSQIFNPSFMAFDKNTNQMIFYSTFEE